MSSEDTGALQVNSNSLAGAMKTTTDVRSAAHCASGFITCMCSAVAGIQLRGGDTNVPESCLRHSPLLQQPQRSGAAG
jgi:hypothetical protein